MQDGAAPIEGWNKGEVMKREHVMLWVSLAFVIGFVAGSTVAILKGRKHMEHPPLPLTASSPRATAPPSIEDTEKIEELKEQLRHNPGDHRSWLRLGKLYADNGQIPLAVDAFRHYLALKPGDARAWTNLGNLLKRSGDMEEAAKAFKKADEIDPQLGRKGS
jgi:cytochrome c-type biogenesis protein CcmH